MILFEIMFRLDCVSLQLENWEATKRAQKMWFKPLAPNDIYICRTAQLTSRRCILNIYSTNTFTEYFKHAAHPPFFLFKMPFIS